MATKTLDVPTAPSAARPPRHTFYRIMVAVLLALMVMAGIFLFRFAWSQTVLREEYLPEIETAVNHSPNDGNLLVLLGLREAQAGDFSTASDTLKRAIAAGQDQADVWQVWAAAFAASGDRVRGLAALDLGIHSVRDPKDVTLLKEARTRAAAVRVTDPAGALAQAICPTPIDDILDRRFPGSFLNGFSAMLGKRDPEKSGYATRRGWAAAAPNDAQGQRLWGLALLRNRRIPVARSVLEKAVALAPGDPDIHVAYADSLFAAGAKAQAGLEYEASLKLHRDYLPALLGLGQVALDKPLIALSVSVFQRATKVAPNSPDAWIGLGRAYYNTHIQLGQSVEAFQKATVLAPQRTDFFPDYFRALRLSFKYADAEALIRRRLKDAPDDGQSHFLLGLLLRDYQPSPEREAEAEKELRISLKITPRSESVEVALAQLLLQKNNLNEAIPLLNDVLIQNELNVKAIKMLERAYRQGGAPKIAERFHQQAQEKVRISKQLGDLEDAEHRNPADGAVHSKLAALYHTLGRTAEAAQEQKFAMFLKNHPVAAKRAIQTLDSQTNISHPVLQP